MPIATMGRKYHHGSRPVVPRLQIAAEMLLHEEEVEEFRIGALHEDEPGQRDREEQRDAAQRERAPHDRQVALDRRVDDERKAGEHDADEPLRQDRASHGRPGERHRPRADARIGVRPMGGDEREERHRMKEGEPDVEREDLRAHQHGPGTCEHGARHQSLVRAPPSPPEDCRDDHEDEAGQRGPQPRRPLVGREDPEGERREPVLERRLLEVLEPVEARRDVVAAREHFARDLGVARFVRPEERACLERAEPQHAQEHAERGEGRPARRGFGRIQMAASRVGRACGRNRKSRARLRPDDRIAH